MSRAFLRALVVLGALVMAFVSPVSAQDESLGEIMRKPKARRASGSQALGTSGAASDTVYVGHSYTDHTGAPGPIVNYWNIYTGNYRPGVNDPNNAIWDWDHSTGFGAYVSDSLAGWWPVVRTYGMTGASSSGTDNNRPWWALDYGNGGNYVINQGAGSKRTVGVTGYWHRDAGVGQGSAVTWSPISGSNSAWCGLRQHGDNSAMDPITGNPYNQTVLEFVGEGEGGTGTNRNFPGYANQMDQMLYRDIAATSGQSLTLAFDYRTLMSTGVITVATTRTGWFDKDPLAVTAGNFISSSAAGAAAPIDSFMVYIGSPVDEASCRYSDGATAPVYDPQRRWFSEVLRVNEGGAAPYYQLLSTFGANPADTLSPALAFSAVVPAGAVDAILGTSGNPGRIRLVFRVKTNSFQSDIDSRTSGFTSRGRGAAIIDNVTYAIGVGATVAIGDFETGAGANSIDNQLGASATDHWKSTGKPPAIYFHPRALSELAYADLCGPPDSPARFCNLGGVVITAGNFDDGEHHADRRYAAGREVIHAFQSPTVNLVTPLDGSPNEQGLTTSIVNVTDDIYLCYDMYAGMFNTAFTGMSWQFGALSYPAMQTGNGAKVWGAAKYPSFTISNPEPQCFTDWEPLYGYGAIVTSNPSGRPDSLRVRLAVLQACYRFGISLGCNSADGAYFDNVSLAFVDLPTGSQTAASQAVTLGPISAFISNFYNDAFPANETPGLPGTAEFDTCGAWLQTGLNSAVSTSSLLRNVIPGDTMLVNASNATVSSPDDPNLSRVRADLVFRILPGPGNYQIASGRDFPPTASMQLLNVPSDQASVVIPGAYDASPTAGAQNFFASFIAKPGQFAKGDHFGNSRWDHLTWNSARCDTAELNRFPVSGIGVSSGLTPAVYASMYHEAEFLPAGIRPELGIAKNRCFLVNPASTNTTHANITCTSVPAWVSSGAPGNGYDGNFQTPEFTKIIPDGLLTPGSHVQYFYRKSHEVDPLLSFAMLPDTNLISPQSGEGSTDGHRWQQFGILPDRWKDPAFDGTGMACALLVDGNDRRGNERVWVSVMDSIGGTSISDRGNHNGWGGIPDSIDYTSLSIADPRLAPYAIANRNKQPGTTWDMYGVKASESLSTQAGALGSRLATKAVGFAAGKDSRQGPTMEMLRTYYRSIIYLSGDLTSGVLGPLVNRSSNDVALIEDFLRTPGGTSQPRAFFAIGDGFAQSETQAGGVDASHTDFLQETLGLRLRNGSYQAISGNVNACADLLATSYIQTTLPIYGVTNLCTAGSNDLLQPSPSMPEATEAVYYENAGVNGPYAASILKPTNGPRPWVAATLGVDLESIRTQSCNTTLFRQKLVYKMLQATVGSVCDIAGGGMWSWLDVPTGGARELMQASLLLKGNVQRTGPTQVVFATPSRDRVRIDLHDVAGRRVRLLADRVFEAGEHTLTWDGIGDDGVRAARGVYFLRMSVGGRDGGPKGRIVVLR